MIPSKEIASFRKIVRAHFKQSGRDLPWRKTNDPYKILVSEIMLQQTQVDRVLPKYQAFIKRFPTVKKLAAADQSEVLKMWTGLGYNRRAINLQKAAKIICNDFRGTFPKSKKDLLQLPGIGPYTAAAIATFACNQPEVLIETNIRSVFIHYFFPRKKKVSDKQLLPIIEQALDKKNPHDWYSALMDYGSWLKKQGSNPSRQSLHHAKQSKFKGSDRELRGKILKLLLAKQSISQKELLLDLADDRTEKKIIELEREGFLLRKGATISLKK